MRMCRGDERADSHGIELGHRGDRRGRVGAKVSRPRWRTDTVWASR